MGRSRIRRAAKCAGALLTVVVAVIWAASLRFNSGVISNRMDDRFYVLMTGPGMVCGSAYDGFSLRRGWCRTYPALAYEIDWPTASTGGVPAGDARPA